VRTGGTEMCGTPIANLLAIQLNEDIGATEVSLRPSLRFGVGLGLGVGSRLVLGLTFGSGLRNIVNNIMLIYIDSDKEEAGCAHNLQSLRANLRFRQGRGWAHM
jgi:hypothetical protein